MKNHFLAISRSSSLFVVVLSLMFIVLPVFADPPADLNNTTFKNPTTDVSGWNQTVTITSIDWNGEQLCIRETPSLSMWPIATIGQEEQRGNIWVVVPGASGGGWTATFVGPIRSDQTKGTVCNQGEGQKGSDFLACTIKTPVIKGTQYGFFLATPARGNVRTKNERSNIKMATWERPSSTAGAENATDCLNVSPEPTPGSSFSCVSGDDGSKYCSYDATGKYTTSNCDNVCPPLPPNVIFTCRNGNQCVASKTGIYADLASCSKYCSPTVIASGPPEITKIQPVEASVNAQIEIYGKNLSEKIQLISTIDQSATDITGKIFDATRELIKFDVPSVPAGIYQVSVFGWGDYADKTAISPQNLTVKDGGDDFTGTTTLGVPEGYQSLGELFTFIFAWSLRILGITVFVMIFYAGVLWMTAAGNTSQVGEAKKRMTNAVLGAILLLSAYLILYTINPDLVGGTWTLPGIGQ